MKAEVSDVARSMADHFIANPARMDSCGARETAGLRGDRTGNRPFPRFDPKFADARDSFHPRAGSRGRAATANIVLDFRTPPENSLDKHGAKCALPSGPDGIQPPALHDHPP